MIETVKCVILECDNCKEPYESYSGFGIFVDEAAAIEEAQEDGWDTHYEEGKHYCGECHHYDDSDVFIINSDRTKKDEKM